MNYVGTVIAARFAPGSKSDRPGVFLQTDTQRLLLRRAGGNAMKDESLDAFVGLTVEVEGVIHQNVLVASDIRRKG